MPVIKKALDDYFRRFPVSIGEAVAVAVSGGADSLCLAINTAEYAKAHNIPFYAVTVDHGLRPESCEEANWVHNVLTKRHIQHEVLTWTEKKPTACIEEKARKKRYELMTKWCHKNKIGCLLLAHHIGDQTETFWARLARGSGIDGLCAMEEQSYRDGIKIGRPILGLKKADFETDLKRRHVLWCEDKMNQDESYERVRWRHRQPELNHIGLTPGVVERSVRRLQRARSALTFYTNRFVNALVETAPQGYTFVPEQAFNTLPTEIQLRVLTYMMTTVRVGNNIVSMDALEQWLINKPKQATVGGCVLVRQSGMLFVTREIRKPIKPTAVMPNKPTYRGRFCILTSCPIQVSDGIDDKFLPYAIRKSIPLVEAKQPVNISFIVGTQKELEKKFAIAYKEKKSDIVCIAFMKGVS